MMPRLTLVAGLAMQELRHEGRLFLCAIAGLAAVLAPLIVLFGLKSGIIGGLREELIAAPAVRTILNTSYGSFDAAFFARWAARPDVAFLVPRARYLSAEGRIEAVARPGNVATAELLATAQGDPLLPGLALGSTADIVPSTALAARLGLASGEAATLRVRRGQGSAAEILAVPVWIAAVAPPSAFDRVGAFVSLTLLTLVEEFGDGKLPADTRLVDVTPDPARSRDGFRMHARRLEDVVVLDKALRAEGVDVSTRAADIAGLLTLDRDLVLLFAVIAGMGGTGYLVALGASQYAGVERKRRELSLLRLAGLRRRDLVMFPLLQAVAVAVAGSGLAGAIAVLVAAAVNGVGPGASEARPLCVIRFEHLGMALAVTCAGATLAAGFAAARAARVPPAEGLHDA